MRPLRIVLTLLLFTAGAHAAAPPSPAAAARSHLAAGAYDRVLDDLAAAKGPPAELGALYAAAAQMAFAAPDLALAGLYCEMALARVADERRALEVCARVAMNNERWDDARRYGDALGQAAPKDPRALLLRAEIASAEGRWATVVELLEPRANEPAIARAAQPVLARAKAELEAERAALGEQRALEQRLERAVADARALDRVALTREEGEAEARRKADPVRSAFSEVVLYSAAWCGACKRARGWLQENKVEFVEKDIDRSRLARGEMEGKCRRAGIRRHGIPVLDAHGQLLVGFDPGSYAAALR